MPVGRSGVVSVAVPVKPLNGVRDIVEAPEDPCWTVILERLALRLKSGGDGVVTVTVKVAEL